MNSAAKALQLLRRLNTTGRNKSASGVRTSSTLKPGKAVRTHQRHGSATSITPLNPSPSLFQAARDLRPHGFQAQFGSNLLQQEITSQTQVPLGR
jgi:hypothetical protein